MKLAVRYTDGTKETFLDAPLTEGLNLTTYMQEYKDYISKLRKRGVATLLVEVDYIQEEILA